MDALFTQIFTILTQSPGNIIFHLVLAFTLLAGLQTTITLNKAQSSPAGKRMLVGFGFLLGIQALAFILSGLAWQQVIDAKTVLPPLDRGLVLLNVIWAAWLWSFPEPNKIADAALAALTLLATTLLLVSMAVWAKADPTMPYNNTLLAVTWDYVTAGAVLAGGVVLLIRRPVHWGFGLGMTLVLFAGYMIYLVFPQLDQDYSGIIRLAQFASFPILLTLSQRLLHPAEGGASAAAPVSRPAGKERRRYSTDPKAFTTLVSIAAEAAPEKILDALAHGVAQAMLSDLCYLVWWDSMQSQVVIRGGYDLIREENLQGTVLEGTRIPAILGALSRGKSLRLTTLTAAGPDLNSIAEAIGLSSVGNVLGVPVVDHNRPPEWGMLLLSPYSNREWNLDDQNYLTAANDAMMRIIRRSQLTTNEAGMLDLQDAQAEIANLQAQNQELAEKLRSMETAEPAKISVHDENMANLLNMQEELQGMITTLQAENEELKAALTIDPEGESGAETGGEAGPNRLYLEKEVRRGLEEIQKLQDALTQSNTQLTELQARPAGSDGFLEEQVEVISSIAQELRQPMSSILGYTDLVLGESIGILGALQRKFLERIRSSSERMRNLIDDLIQITALESGKLVITPESVDLDAIIDTAMTYVSAQLREKNIVMQVKIPDVLPPLQADRDAVQQIVIHLLQNAGAATPLEGVITLKVLVKEEPDQPPQVLIQVTDSGGGIPPEDMRRVFSRLYRADNPLIQGIGDTGVGLSIAKTLVEAHQGKIWVDTELGKTSSFNVLLPLGQPEAQTTRN